MLGSGGMNLITTLIGFGMSVTFIIFVCTRLICGRLHRMETRRLFEIGSGIGFEMPENRSNGLAPVLLAAIPIIKFQDASGSSEETHCTICLEEYQEEEVLRIIPKCGHTFHLPCIDTWLRRQSTCPVCRLSLHEILCSKFGKTLFLSSGQTSSVHENHGELFQQEQLPPDPERSRANQSNQGNESVSINMESVAEEAEAR